MIGRPHAVAAWTKIEMFRSHDPSWPAGPRIVFWGRSFELQAMATECDRILVGADQGAEKWL